MSANGCRTIIPNGMEPHLIPGCVCIVAEIFWMHRTRELVRIAGQISPATFQTIKFCESDFDVPKMLPHLQNEKLAK